MNSVFLASPRWMTGTCVETGFMPPAGMHPASEWKSAAAVQAGRRSSRPRGFSTVLPLRHLKGSFNSSPRFQIYDGEASTQGCKMWFSAWSTDESCLLRYPTSRFFELSSWRSSQDDMGGNGLNRMLVDKKSLKAIAFLRLFSFEQFESNASSGSSFVRRLTGLLSFLDSGVSCEEPASSGLLEALHEFTSAREIPCLIAPACPLSPPPLTFASTSNSPTLDVTSKGWFTIISSVSRRKYSPISRRFTVTLPVPGEMR